MTLNPTLPAPHGLRGAQINDALKAIIAAVNAGSGGPAWASLTLGTGWTTSVGDQVPQYGLDGMNIVHLRGIAAASSGVGPSLVTTLPLAVRPPKLVRATCAGYISGSTTTPLVLNIATSGDCTISSSVSGTVANLSLDGITFSLAS